MASDNERSPFFNLHGEIRNRIYEYLVDPCNPYHHQYGPRRPKSHHMALMLSCRQLYDEYSSFFWRNAIFVFNKYKDLHRFTGLTAYRSQKQSKLPYPAHLALNFSTFDLLMFTTDPGQRSLKPSPHAHASKLFNPCLVGGLETLTIRIPCRTQLFSRRLYTQQQELFSTLQQITPHSTVTGLALIGLLPYLEDIPEVLLEGCVTEEQKKTFELVRREFNERTSNSRVGDTADEPEQCSTAAWMQLVKPPARKDFPSLEYLRQHLLAQTPLPPNLLIPSLVLWEDLSTRLCGLTYFDLLWTLREHYTGVMIGLGAAIWFCDDVDCISKPGDDHDGLRERSRLRWRI